MKPLDYFNGCTTGDFTTSKGKLDWRIEGGVIYFQPSKGALDWFKNLLAFPFPVILNRVLMIVPFGVALDLPELRRIWKVHLEIKVASGYSRGGWCAVLTAFKFRCIGITFGCPNIFWNPSRNIRSFLHGYITHFEGPNDIVCRVPPRFVKGTNRRILYGKAFKCKDKLYELSGHSPDEYRMRLEGVEW